MGSGRASRLRDGHLRILVTLTLAGCAHIPVSLVSLDGSPTDNLSRVAVVAESETHPALLRGLDGAALNTMRVPNELGKYAYVLNPGHHLFWLKSVPYPNPLIPQHLRCYTLTVELAPGMRYLLEEDVGAKRASLVRRDTGEVVSTGELVDQPWVFERDCKWE